MAKKKRNRNGRYTAQHAIALPDKGLLVPEERVLDLQDPASADALDEEQTSRIATLPWEVAGHPSRGLTPARLARILDSADTGDLIEQNDLFEDMEERDSHLFAELSKRRRSVLGLDWTLVPPVNATSREMKQANTLAELIRSTLDVESIIYDCTDAIGKGYACLELDWSAPAHGQRLINTTTLRPQRWFMVPPFDRNDLRLRNPAFPYGEPLWPFGWIVHKHAAKNGYLTRQALFRVLAWPYLFKHYSVRDLAEFLEIYGLPLRLGKYPAGATPVEKSTLLRAVMSIGHAAAGIIPQGMSIDFQKAADGHADPYKLMIEWAEAAISKAIVGQTLTAQSGSRGEGSRALGEVHDNVRWDITVSDARQLQPTLTRQLVYPLGLLNGLVNDPDRCPRFTFDVAETEDLGVYAKALPELAGLDMKIPISWAHQKLGIPMAADDEPILKGAATPAPMIPAPLKAALKVEVSDTAPAPSDLIADRLVQETTPIIQGWLKTVEDILEAANSLDEARAMLVTAFDKLPTDALVSKLVEGHLAAHLAGRFDLEQQSE